MTLTSLLHKKGFSLIEMSLFLVVLAAILIPALNHSIAIRHQTEINASIERFTGLINKTMLMRDYFTGNFANTNTPDVLKYSGYDNSDIISIAGNKLKANLGVNSYYSVTPYFVGGIPKGFIAKAAITDLDKCLSFSAMAKSASLYAEKVYMQAGAGALVKVWDINTGTDSFISGANAVCSTASTIHYVYVYINTMVSAGTVHGGI